MDERKAVIRDLEEKKRTDTDARNRMLEELGEVLIGKLNDGHFYTEAIGAIFAEYDEFKKEIAGAEEAIKALEADNLQMKELDDTISSGEAKHSQLTKELSEVCGVLGKALSQTQVFGDSNREQEQALLVKIDEQEQKTRELQEREGGVFAWISKNAQIAVAKAQLLKSRTAVQKLYRGVAEQFLADGANTDAIDAEAAELARSTAALKNSLDELGANLADWKLQRRKLADAFGAEGSPSRRIQANQKRIAFIKEGFLALYRKLGALAAVSPGKEALVEVLSAEDNAVLEKAAARQSAIDVTELRLKKVRAEIGIEEENAEIEKIQKAISHQRGKIAAATEEISEFEKQIGECEQNIQDFKKFLTENETNSAGE
ncbi:MAG: hypothetical protein FWD91_03430 [Treponema sp.]|nr:hypothetical protein [Treponema sp.]